MSYDSRCYDLAAVFLDGKGLEPAAYFKACDALAQHIQSSIEDWIEFDDGAPPGANSREEEPAS